MNIKGNNVNLLMDTGASCNVISEHILRKIHFDLDKIKKDGTILKTYDGSKLSVLGKVILSCERGN